MDEIKNAKNRKNQSLTNSEWLTFFLLPYRRQGFDSNSLDTFNVVEEKRFMKYGFDKKLKESAVARKLGIVFYLALGIIIYYLINYI